ncbi:MAG TPA: hypothetical protein EYP56_14515, partial [Planctomycetaceae bacterium]|nr:hypothetical protein [Planctomycetaceae bacterium]
MWVSESYRLRLEIESAGSVLPWIGPALRGLVAGRLKAMVCRHPRPDREAHWQYCDGCPYLKQCAYGRLFEPPALFGGTVSAGVTSPEGPDGGRGAVDARAASRAVGRGGPAQARPVVMA